MADQQKYIDQVRKSYRKFCDIRRETREHLWNARQALKDPTLSPEERDSWEEIAFQNAQLIEKLDEDIADTERTLGEMEARAERIKEQDIEIEKSETNDRLMGVVIACVIFLLLVIVFTR